MMKKIFDCLFLGLVIVFCAVFITICCMDLYLYDIDGDINAVYETYEQCQNVIDEFEADGWSRYSHLGSLADESRDSIYGMISRVDTVRDRLLEANNNLTTLNKKLERAALKRIRLYIWYTVNESSLYVSDTVKAALDEATAIKANLESLSTANVSYLQWFADLIEFSFDAASININCYDFLETYESQLNGYYAALFDAKTSKTELTAEQKQQIADGLDEIVKGVQNVKERLAEAADLHEYILIEIDETSYKKTPNGFYRLLDSFYPLSLSEEEKVLIDELRDEIDATLIYIYDDSPTFETVNERLNSVCVQIVEVYALLNK